MSVGRQAPENQITFGYRLRPSAYDNAASLLLAALALVGTSVLILFLVWLTARTETRQVAVPVLTEPIGDGGGLGDSMELDPNVEVPGLEVEFEQPELEEMVASISDAISSQPAVLQDPTLWDSNRQGRGGPIGDGRAPGSGRGKPGKQRSWEFQFIEGNTLKTYAEQLDYFEIELGVLLPGNRLVYAYNLADDRPSRREGPADQEQRYYMTWRNGPLKEADNDLLRAAGIQPDEGLIVKFLTPELEATLDQMERQAAGGDAERVRKTYYAIQRDGDGYRFRVVDQAFGLR